MKELVRTGDRVRLGYLQALLDGAGIDWVVLDDITSSLIPGAVLPRLMVDDGDLVRACRVLREAGETPA